MYFGTCQIDKAYRGTCELDSIYRGACEVFSSGSTQPPGMPDPVLCVDFGTASLQPSNYAPAQITARTTTPSETFTLACQDVGVFDCDVYWGDGGVDTITAFNQAELTHTYADAGDHQIVINGDFPNFYFHNNPDQSKLISIDTWGDLGIETCAVAFRECVNLEFIAPTESLKTVSSFSDSYRGSTGFTEYPDINMSAATNISSAWYGCTGMTSFVPTDLSAVTIAQQAWRNCTGLTQFPLVLLPSVSNLSYAWAGCTGLAQFPTIIISSANNLSYAWSGCTALIEFPANMFDTCTATNYTGAFTNTLLSSGSMDNILVSIDTAGQSNGTLDISGGPNIPGPAGQAAASSLIGKGWTLNIPS